MTDPTEDNAIKERANDVADVEMADVKRERSGKGEEGEKKEGEIVEGSKEKAPTSPTEWVQKWATDSSCNGVPNVVRSQHAMRKAFWVAIVVAGTVMTVMNVMDTFRQFYDYPYNVIISITFKTSTTFPAITICNANIVRRSKLGLAGDALRNIVKSESHLNASEFMFSDARPELKEHFTNIWTMMNETVQKELGHQLSDMLISCSFKGMPCHPERDFVTIINPMYGNCFSFNTGWHGTERRMVHRPGPDHGLTLELYIQQEEYIREITDAAGIHIAVHHFDTMPFPEDSGIFVGPGLLSLVGIMEEELLRLQAPFESACLTKESAMLKNLSIYSEHFPVRYSEQACIKTCYQRQVVKECACADPHIPRMGIALRHDDYARIPAPPCLTEKEERCEHRIKEKAENGNLECECAVQCNTFDYPTSTSQAMWPNEALEEMYVDAASDKVPLKHSHGIDPRRNLLRLQIFYQEMNSKRITEQKAYTVTNLYSDLGGNIGFYLGLSIVSLFEFLELICDVVNSCCLCLKHKCFPTRKRSSHRKTRNYKNGRSHSSSAKGQRRVQGMRNGDTQSQGLGKGHVQHHGQAKVHHHDGEKHQNPSQREDQVQGGPKGQSFAKGQIKDKEITKEKSKKTEKTK